MEALSAAYLYTLQRNYINQVLSKLICHGDNIAAAFPNLSNLAMILALLPVTTATVECSFSSMKLKTSMQGEDSLERP